MMLLILVSTAIVAAAAFVLGLLLHADRHRFRARLDTELALGRQAALVHRRPPPYDWQTDDAA
jgi:hypothetical protein